MGTISLLDCTLRDGGYINEWYFGKNAISFILKKLNSVGIEFIEVGFIQGDKFDEDRPLYPNTQCIKKVINPKSNHVKYVGMIDMNKPVPIENIEPYDGEGIDAIRVIFKQNRVDEGYEYVKKVKDLGYMAMVQLVSTNTYSDEELIKTFNKFNAISPYAVYIVDSLGVFRRKDFLRMIYLADNHLSKDISLGYHSHNNLQQAMGNAETLVELGLSRDIIIDASVYGMGRGAGNLNMELFAEYLNEFRDKHYRIEPMLEIIDEYLNDIYKRNFWGYSLPFYLSAKNGCHPNYAKFYSEKGTLTEKTFNELLKTISEEDKTTFSEAAAEGYYKKYLENYVDDRDALSALHDAISGRNVLFIGPGNSIKEYRHLIDDYILTDNPIVISGGFYDPSFNIDYLFCCHIRNYSKLKSTNVKKILTSNLRDVDPSNVVVNFASYVSEDNTIYDNSGIMLIKLLISIGVDSVTIAGMDGYEIDDNVWIQARGYESNNKVHEVLNDSISKELSHLSNYVKIKFITPTKYKLE